MAHGSGICDRLREVSGLWHLWRANVLEDAGGLPEGFEDCVLEVLTRALGDTRAQLAEATCACDEATAALRVGAGGVGSSSMCNRGSGA